MKIYLAGPMTGIEDNNFPAFNTMAKSLRNFGYDVVNPAELDAGETTTQPWDYYLRRDLKKLVDCDSVAVLPGWEKSKGAQLEIFVAKALGMEILEAETLKILVDFSQETKNKKSESVLEEAQRLVGGDRGSQYGHPIEDFTRTGRIWAAILGIPEVTPDKVALCMVGVKMSREVNKPKRDNRVDGPGYFLCLDMVRERMDQNAVH